MGVKGLMTYIVDERSSLKPHKLRKMRLIIDGNNLLHSIHQAHNLIWQFGGEYEAFDKALVKFFNRLQLCELEPFVIFDGCYDAEGSKFQTTISRFKDRIHTCFQLNKNYSNNGYLLPMLAMQTIISVLQRLNISYGTCNQEADKEAAALANYFNCPVISNDSDFFIFPLNYGFIPVGCLNFIPVKEDCDCCPSKSHHYLPCSLFHQSNLRVKSPNHQRIKQNFMSLFSTLMGNDFHNINFFDMIFMQNPNGKKNKNTKISSKIDKILVWLQQFDSVENAVKQILSFTKESDRCCIERKINSSLAQYDLSNSVLVESIKSGGVNLQNKDDIFSRLPIFVQNNLRKGILSPILMNSILSGNVFLSTYVESIKSDSIHTITGPIRKQIYRLLSSFVGEFPGDIFEYSRRGRIVDKRVINIESMDGEELTDNLLSVSEEVSFVSLLIRYWLLLTDKMSPCFPSVLALITSIWMQFCWQCEIASPNSTFFRDRYDHSTWKFFTNPIVSNLHGFRIESVHLFNEIQSMYFSLTQLLCLYEGCLMDMVPPPQRLFCGKLSYNLTADFIKRSNCWAYARQLFDKYPNHHFRDLFIHSIDDASRLWPEFAVYLSQFHI